MTFITFELFSLQRKLDLMWKGLKTIRFDLFYQYFLLLFVTNKWKYDETVLKKKGNELKICFKIFSSYDF